jgi:hypothetical protein
MKRETEHGAEQALGLPSSSSSSFSSGYILGYLGSAMCVMGTF